MPDTWLAGSRFLLYLSLMLAFGVPGFVWWATRRLALDLPVIGRIQGLTGGAIVVALTASVLALAAMASQMSGTAEPSEVWATAWIVLTQTTVGLTWSIRMVALVVALGVVGIAPVSRFSSLAVAFLCAGALATLAWTGHGAMSEGGAGLLHVGADILHLIFAGAWLGAIAVLALVAASAARTSDRGELRLLAEASSGFANIGVLIVAVLVVTGTINYVMTVGPTLTGLVSEPYGRLLLAKLGAFAAMLLLAASHRFRLVPRLERALADCNALHATSALKRSLWCEAFLAVFILGLVSWLGMLNPTG